MTESNHDVKAILDRILKSYGVSSRPELAELLKIPLPTIQNWVSRQSLPGDYIVMCAMDTGADVRWLINGEVANVDRKTQNEHAIRGERLLDTMQASGGKPILKRLLDAYGFSMQKQLGEHLGVPSGTMSAWLRRDHFPGEVVIACALDTGVSLYWLATGNGSMYEEGPLDRIEDTNTIKIPKHHLSNGKLVEQGCWYGDRSLFNEGEKSQIIVEKGGNLLCVDVSAQTISNGMWLISIDGIIDLYDVIRLPGNKLKLSSEAASFECGTTDITPKGKVTFYIKNNL